MSFGGGGMSRVYLAYNPGSPKPFYVLKNVAPSNPATDRQRFLDEVWVTQAIKHPNVVEMYGSYEDIEGNLCMEMELLRGTTLKELLTTCSGTVPLGFACRVIHDVCRALHAAHFGTFDHGRPLNVIHRDIHPKNVMVTFDGLVKVIDFGIARFSDRTFKTNTPRMCIGYAAPERIEEALQVMQGGRRRGGTAAVDHRSDLYSAALLFYELVCGNTPLQRFLSLDAEELWSGVGEQCELDLSDAPTELRALMRKALSDRPEDRFATGDAMAEAIADAAGHQMFLDPEMRQFVHSRCADAEVKLNEKLEELKRLACERAVSPTVQNPLAGVTTSELASHVGAWGEAEQQSVPRPAAACSPVLAMPHEDPLSAWYVRPDDPMKMVFGDTLAEPLRRIAKAAKERRIQLVAPGIRVGNRQMSGGGKPCLDVFKRHYRTSLMRYGKSHFYATSLPYRRYFWGDEEMSRCMRDFLSGGGRFTRVFFVAPGDMEDSEVQEVLKAQVDMGVNVYVADVEDFSADMTRLFLFNEQQGFGWEVGLDDGQRINRVNATANPDDIEEYVRMYDRLQMSTSVRRYLPV